MQLSKFFAASLALLPSLVMAAPNTEDKRYLDTVAGTCSDYQWWDGQKPARPFCYSDKYVLRECPGQVCNSCTLSSDGSVACW